MFFVQWNNSKYHVLDESAAAIYQDADGNVTARPSSNGRGNGFALTKCGQSIGSDNKAFQRRPENQDVCGNCDNGIGVFKVNPTTARADVSKRASASAGKVKDRSLNAARALFGSPNEK